MIRLVPYRIAFFDIGNTLGHVSAEGSTLQLRPFNSTGTLLQIFAEALGLRLGIITNSGPYGLQDIRAMLDRVGLTRFFEPALVVTSAEVEAQKPDAKIYIIAAARAGVSIGECLYIGEDPKEVEGAQRTGMGGLLKPVPT
jgi:FMN phosphatase YigB (HAD superfamily)